MKTTKLKITAMAMALLSSVSIAQAVGENTVAPEIAVQDRDGKTVKLADLKGKVVVVDFWASWCAPCRDELPVLQELYGKYHAKGLEIVGVGLDRDKDKFTKFMRALPLSFRVIHDPAGGIADKYEPPKMPSSYLIDKRGMIRHLHAGFKASDKAVFEREISALLSEK